MVPSSYKKPLLQIVLFATYKIFAQYTPTPGYCEDYCQNTTDCLCRGSTYDNLPNNFSTTLKKLTFDRALIKQFRKKDAERYPNLEEFSYSGYGPEKYKRTESKFDADFFLAFPKLRELFLCCSVATQGQKLLFPNQLNKLLLAEMDLVDDNLDLSYLTNLNKLHLFDNLLTTVPPLNKTTSLEILDMRKNPLTSIPTKILWSFCKLHTLLINETKGLLDYFKNECECRRFTEFVNRQNLTKNDEWKPDCRVTCSEVVTPEMQADYNACMNIGEEKETKSGLKKIILLVVATLIFLILVAIAIAYFIKNRGQKAAQATTETPMKEIENELVGGEEEQEMPAKVPD